MATKNIYELADTWNNVATTFDAIAMSVTDTNSSAESNLLRLAIGGTDRYRVRKDGRHIIRPTTLTGSEAGNIFDIAVTWNTTGTPTGIILNVTDTASNAASLLMDLQVGGTSMFRVSKAGLTRATSITVGTSATAPRIFTHGGMSAVTETANGSNLSFIATAAGANNETRFQFATSNASSLTVGTFNLLRLKVDAAPTSGTGVITQLLIEPVVNQTGGANGITRGVLANPTLTSAADWRSYDCTNATGFAYHSSGAAPSRLGGPLTLSASYFELNEMTAPAAPAANGARIFAEDNGAGKTRLMVRFASGASQQIAIEP